MHYPFLQLAVPHVYTLDFSHTVSRVIPMTFVTLVFWVSCGTHVWILNMSQSLKIQHPCSPQMVNHRFNSFANRVPTNNLTREILESSGICGNENSYKIYSRVVVKSSQDFVRNDSWQMVSICVQLYRKSPAIAALMRTANKQTF